MKLLLDENLSPSLRKRLMDEFEEVRHVREFGLVSAADGVIWEFARSRGFLVVTRDKDFYNRALVSGAPPKILWLQLHNGSTDQYASLILWYRDALVEFVADEFRALCVLPPESLP